MKKCLIFALVIVLSMLFISCRSLKKDAKKENDPIKEKEPTTVPQVTEPEAPEDPFEFEAEIDFSEFETESLASEPAATDPVETAPDTTEPTETQPETTEPVPSQPESTVPEPTEPVAPPTEPDGYSSQIVRP